jgi:catechol 2,3-dioxygenase-like lactoylglutathione lyase family enzyme
MAAASIDELTLNDDPDRWAAYGFDVGEGICTLATVAVRLAGDGGGIAGWSLRGASATELDGLPTAVSGAPEREPAGPHPNGVTAIDHVVAMTPDLERTVAALQAAGLDLRRIREEPTPAGAPRQAFFRLGAEILEVVQEPEQVLAAPGARERGARFWGLALRTQEIERSAAAFGEHAGTIRPAVQEGRMIVTIKRSAGLGVPLALMSEPQGTRRAA